MNALYFLRNNRFLFMVACLLTLVINRSAAQAAGPTNAGPQISITSPTNGATFIAPATIQIIAAITDSNSFVHEVGIFAGTNRIAFLIIDPLANELHGETNSISYIWSSVPTGDYALTVTGTDLNGITSTSAPVNITVNPQIPPIPTVTIVATDPFASLSGDAGTFTVYRTGSTSNNLNVFYTIGGTASNGVDYDTLPITVTIPAGAASATIAVTPIPDPLPDPNETVVLHLTQPPYMSPMIPTTYLIGQPDTAVVTILGNVSNIPPVVTMILPTDGEIFPASANILLLADAFDPDGFVRTVEFFEGTNSLGIATNNPIVVEPLTTVASSGGIVSPINPFHLVWTNVPTGDYDLTAVATDNGGAMATSAPVHIIVTNLPPPTNFPPVVAIETPTNGQTFGAFGDIRISASALDVDGFVRQVEFFQGSNSLGVVTNFPIILANTPSNSLPPFHLYTINWSNVPPGDFILTAVATDNLGDMGTSAPVSITVTTNLPPPTNIPPIVAIETPTNGASFTAPVNIPIFAFANDPDGYVKTVEFFEGTTSLGIATNFPILVEPLAYSAGPGLPVGVPGGIIYPINPFHIVWTNVPAGNYVLTAVATDNGGATGTSAPVSITVTNPLPVTNPPVVSIFATDPIAVEGTNFICFTPATVFTNFCGGTNTATFLVRRVGDTNSDLTVNYAIGGTASNGVDYVALPGFVTIPAGQHFALITVVPIDDIDPTPRRYDTVILSLQPSTVTNTPPPYLVGRPARAEAVILEDRDLPWASCGFLPDGSFHAGWPGSDGANYCLEVSTDLLNWLPVCTNTVVKGSVHFLDPDAGSAASQYYRVIPVAGPPLY